MTIHIKNDFQHISNNNFDMISIPFTTKRVSLLIYRPKAKVKYFETKEILRLFQTQSIKKVIDIYFPKINIEYTMNFENEAKNCCFKNFNFSLKSQSVFSQPSNVHIFPHISLKEYYSYGQAHTFVKSDLNKEIHINSAFFALILYKTKHNETIVLLTKYIDSP
ncbi:hypothetical protein A3Q56_00754 [Intoshia linei]|uniref:Serpin domain-containing protein n=1 Tax=Intoshia linei TaxID=1819745 RepID=A0A177BAZ6_9BILA|nr:hypothetical protein A3Q56_00754 [Intoshia linei]